MILNMKLKYETETLRQFYGVQQYKAYLNKDKDKAGMKQVRMTKARHETGKA